MGYERVKLVEVASIRGGKRLPAGREFTTTKTAHPYIRARDIGGGKVEVHDPVFLDEVTAQKLVRYTVNKGDVCLTIVGANVGEMGVVPPHLNGANLTENAVKIVTNGKADQLFLKYALLSDDAMAQMKVLAGGAAQPKLGIYKIETIEFPFPPLQVQRHIADILSVYDELMENNQRRIHILKDMARSLYREWFVHFRYPGHESVSLVDSPIGKIPKGWEVATLGNHLAALESGKRPKGGIKDVDDGVPSIGAENIKGIGNHNFAGEKFVSREFFEAMRKGVVSDRDVAIYKDGAYIGKSSYFRDGFPHAECCVNEHVFLLRSNGVRLKQNALYLWLQEPDTVHAIRATNANAAQPGINQQSVGGLELVLPDEKITGHFDRLVDPILAEVIALAKQDQNLRRTRDLLLPRLLSGQINIEAIETLIEEAIA